MNLFKKTTLLGLLGLSSQLLATPGVYEINQACVDVGCFLGDNPATKTVEINQSAGTYLLTSDLVVDAGDPDAIVVSAGQKLITIDLNGFQIRTTDIPESSVNAITILGDNSFVTIKNGSIRSFSDGVAAVVGAVVNIDNVVFRLMKDDAVQAARGRIINSSFDCNDYGINAINATALSVGDRLYLENNDFSCISSPDDQDPVFSFGATNVCKDNRISYDAGGATDFGLCLLVGGNICNTAVCTQGRATNAANESKE